MSSAEVRIETLAEGPGHSPHAGDRVVAHYTGWLDDGQKFGSA